jgi:branched-chain amino acid transport system substrate-binding protein
MMLKDAMERASSLDRKGIRDALATTKDFRGVTGMITMDQNRNASKAAVVVEVQEGGGLKFVTRVDPT